LTDEGIALLNQGNYEEAIKCFDKVIEFDPEYSSAWIFKSLALNFP